MLRIGTAGWVIPTHYAAFAPGPGSHLERYARALNCVEINSSFYRTHGLATWQRWADSTPSNFRFSVKFPKAITHVAKLVVSPASLDTFFAETATLGKKLAVILVQLPPSLSFDNCPAAEFFEALRDRSEVDIALEPRHVTWFTPAANDLLNRHQIARVAADPPRDPNQRTATPKPAGWPGLAYFRLHGSPRTYYSNYESAYLAALAQAIAEQPRNNTWVIFDNTASGNAFTNALEMQGLASSKMT